MRMKKIITVVFSLSLFAFSLGQAKAQTAQIQILAPTSGQQWSVGTSQIIKWSAPSSVTNVNINITSYFACMFTTPRCEIATMLIPITTNLPNNGSYTWNIAPNFSAGSYIINITDSGNSNSLANSGVFNITGSADLGSNHPAGSNVSSNGTVYYIQPPFIGGAMPINPPQPTLTAYPSSAVFLSYGFNSWNNVIPASGNDLALSKNSYFMPFADGSLINDNGTVYVISNGSRNGVSSAAVFTGLGYKWSNLISGDTSFMPNGKTISSIDAHLPGTLVNQNGTIYYISGFGKMGFPSISVFNSWGFNLKNVVLANNGDGTILTNRYSQIVSTWTLGQLSPAVGPPAQ